MNVLSNLEFATCEDIKGEIKKVRILYIEGEIDCEIYSHYLKMLEMAMEIKVGSVDHLKEELMGKFSEMDIERQEEEMNDKQFIKSFTIKEQAYLIVVGLTGSWMYDATHKELESEEYCKRIVDQFWSNYATSTLSMVAMYARDTISRCDDCGGRVLFKCKDCVVKPIIDEINMNHTNLTVLANKLANVDQPDLEKACIDLALELDKYEEYLIKCKKFSK